jgi:hypothetical protein
MPLPQINETRAFTGSFPGMTDAENHLAAAAEFRKKAARCRRLALEPLDGLTRDRLHELADEYEARAEELENGRL